MNIRIRASVGNCIRERLKKCGNKKIEHTIKYLGCSIDFFRKYLEEKFMDEMSWENYGRPNGVKGWEIDHKKPASKFNLTKEQEIYKCFHYTNLQPLWWYDNVKKSDKYDENQN